MSNSLAIFPANLVARRGKDNQIVTVEVPTAVKPKRKAPPTKGAGEKKKFTAAIADDETKEVSKGVLFYKLSFLMPNPASATKEIEAFPWVIIKWENPHTTPEMGRIGRGVSNPSDATDKRNDSDEGKGMFSINAARIGTLGDALIYIDRDIESDINAINEVWTFKEGRTAYRSLLTHEYERTDKTTKAKETVTLEKPDILLKCLPHKRYESNSLPRQYANTGRKKTQVLDAEKATLVTDKKGRVRTEYGPFTFTDDEGNEVEIDDIDDLHRAIRRNYIIERLIVFLDKVTNSSLGDNSPHALVDTIVIRAVPDEIIEIDDDEEEDDADVLSDAEDDDEDDETSKSKKPVAKPPAKTSAASAAKAGKPAAPAAKNSRVAAAVKKLADEADEQEEEGEEEKPKSKPAAKAPAKAPAKPSKTTKPAESDEEAEDEKPAKPTKPAAKAPAKAPAKPKKPADDDEDDAPVEEEEEEAAKPPKKPAAKAPAKAPASKKKAEPEPEADDEPEEEEEEAPKPKKPIAAAKPAAPKAKPAAGKKPAKALDESDL